MENSKVCIDIRLAKLAREVMEGGGLKYLIKNNLTELPIQQQVKINSIRRPTLKLVLHMEGKKRRKVFTGLLMRGNMSAQMLAPERQKPLIC